MIASRYRRRRGGGSDVDGGIGTVETPATFADLVCAAARSGRPVTVALEYSSDDQPVVDAFLASNGDARARAALLTLPNWQDEWQDGRSSTAFLALFERLRVLKQAGPGRWRRRKAAAR